MSKLHFRPTFKKLISMRFAHNIHILARITHRKETNYNKSHSSAIIILAKQNIINGINAKYNTLLFNYESSICLQKNDINKTKPNHNKNNNNPSIIDATGQWPTRTFKFILNV